MHASSSSSLRSTRLAARRDGASPIGQDRARAHECGESNASLFSDTVVGRRQPREPSRDFQVRFPQTPPMRFLSVAFALAVWSAAASAQTQPGEIERLRSELMQPGPEARLGREAAIEALLTRKDPPAHAVLHEMLGRGTDPDDVSRSILIQLRRKLANPADPVFGNADRERAIPRSYLPAFARFFDPKRADATAALHEDVRECLMALSPLDRRRGFEDLLKSDESGLRVASLLAAARCRDLGLAPVIAAALELPDVASTASDALRLLTFSEGLSTKATFDEWWAQNSNRTYVQLAEDAARRARDAQAAAQQRADLRLGDTMADLVEAWVTREDVPWAKVADRVLADDPRGSQVACLKRLRDVLARQARVGGGAADRQAFLQRLQSLAKSATGPDRQALLLEVTAYLVLPTDDKLRADMVADLVAALHSDSAVVRRAALQGLARFPTASTIDEIVDVGTHARAAGDQAVLAAALATLGSPDWRAPGEPTLLPWLALLRDVLRDPNLSEQMHEAALSVLEKRTVDDRPLPEAFDFAVELVGDRKQPPVVRERAMLMLVPYSLAAEGQADRYVRTMLAHLADPERRVRLKAAQLLQTLPKHAGGVVAWREDVFKHVGLRLVEETEEGVLRALVNCLERQIDADNPDRGPVISRFCLALEEMAKSAINGSRRALLVSALAGQAATQGLDTMLWIRAGETLAQLGERRDLRNVIDRQRPLALLEREAGRPEVTIRALDLMVSTALLKPAGERWQDLQREARDTLVAIENLGKLRPGIQPATRLLQLELLAGLGQATDVLRLGPASLQEVPFAAADRARVGILLARAHIALEQVDKAIPIVEAGIPAADAADLLRLREEIALALQRKGDLAMALTWMVDVLGQTPERDSSYARRYLRRVEIEFLTNPELRLTSLQRLQEKEALFTASDAPADLRKQYDDLKRLIGGTGG